MSRLCTKSSVLSLSCFKFPNLVLNITEKSTQSLARYTTQEGSSLTSLSALSFSISDVSMATISIVKEWDGTGKHEALKCDHFFWFMWDYKI